MGRINVLAKSVAELIAAGEVIERPSSVIKELLENSIDAGATVITVEIKNGGRTFMRITDNGSGISSEDIPLAFLRHATSKIKIKEDLDNISTLGFRGEALASICAVSKVEVLSKLRGEELGTHYSIHGSEEKLFEQSGCPEGTTIIVRDLFYNVPARLKFLKKDVTEGNAISGIISKVAVSHPEISFKFIRDNKTEILTAGDGKLYSAIFSIFGKDFAKSLIPVDYEYSDVHIKGYISKPLLSKANRSFQNFYINNRYVKSVTCMVALEEAYKNSIMTGKFPACVLNIEVSPRVIDVNVHPSKIEVRFSDEKFMYECVYFAVKNALLQNDTPEEFKFNDKPNFSKEALFRQPIETISGKQLNFSAENNNTVPKNEGIISYSQNDTSNSAYNFDDLKPDKPIKPVKVTETNVKQDNLTDKTYDLPVKNEDIKTETKNETVNNSKPLSNIVPNSEFKYINDSSFEKKSETPKFIVKEEETPTAKVVGEIFKTYIVVEYGKEMYLVDKHAAHERVIFEKIKSDKNLLHIQYLLEPCMVTLSFEEFDAISQKVDELSELGFIVEPDVAPTVAVSGMPTIIENVNPNDIIPELAENIINSKHDKSLDMFDDLYHSIACKCAIKANDYSNHAELSALVNRIFEYEDIRYCPHGRPVLISISKRDIEKQFKRIV